MNLKEINKKISIVPLVNLEVLALFNRTSSKKFDSPEYV